MKSIRLSIAIISALICTCSCEIGRNISKRSIGEAMPTTIGDQRNSIPYGYQPLDPLPVKVIVWGDSGISQSNLFSYNGNDKSKIVMSSLPDETIRLAIGEQDRNGNINFGTGKLGYGDNYYTVILDYIKFDTKTLNVRFKKDSANCISDFMSESDWGRANEGANKHINTNDIHDDLDSTIGLESDLYDLKASVLPDASIPVYVGVGLRFTASVYVTEGSVDLSNLFEIGLKADQKKIIGTIVIQTLGVSGKDISSLIPMPSQINTTTIQNAIMSLASIKSKMYDSEVQLNPRIVGFYNNIGCGRSTVQKFITHVQRKIIEHNVYSKSN
jgi:hypothetical protein